MCNHANHWFVYDIMVSKNPLLTSKLTGNQGSIHLTRLTALIYNMYDIGIDLYIGIDL